MGKTYDLNVKLHIVDVIKYFYAFESKIKIELFFYRSNKAQKKGALLMRNKELEARMLQARATKSASSDTQQKASVPPFAARARSPFAASQGGSPIRPSAPRPSSAAGKSSSNHTKQSQAGAGQQPLELKQLPTQSEILRNGFTQVETEFLHKSIRVANMQWFEGEGCILIKRDPVELCLRPGQSEMTRWVVLSFPVIDMNEEGGIEAALHFLTESFNMAHAIELQFQPAINVETEKLEFLMQLPLEGIDATNLGQMIEQFVVALADGVREELSRILQNSTQPS